MLFSPCIESRALLHGRRRRLLLLPPRELGQRPREAHGAVPRGQVERARAQRGCVTGAERGCADDDGGRRRRGQDRGQRPVAGVARGAGADAGLADALQGEGRGEFE